MKLNQNQIRSAHQAVERVKSIDDTISWLGRDAPDKVAEHGKKARDIFGRNRMSHFLDSHLGEVILCAVINALLEKRGQEIATAADVVEFPDPPCPRQTVQPQD